MLLSVVANARSVLPAHTLFPVHPSAVFLAPAEEVLPWDNGCCLLGYGGSEVGRSYIFPCVLRGELTGPSGWEQLTGCNCPSMWHASGLCFLHLLQERRHLQKSHYCGLIYIQVLTYSSSVYARLPGQRRGSWLLCRGISTCVGRRQGPGSVDPRNRASPLAGSCPSHPCQGFADLHLGPSGPQAHVLFPLCLYFWAALSAGGDSSCHPQPWPCQPWP